MQNSGTDHDPKNAQPGQTAVDDKQRQDMMQRDVLLVVAAALSLVSGMHFSPYFDPIFFLIKPFAASFYISSPLLLLYFTSLFISLLTLIIGGIPAAIFERARGLDSSSPVSIGLWVVAVAIISLPAIFAFFG